MLNLKKLVTICLFFISIGLYSQTNGNYNWILAQDGASTNNYLKWNGTGWVPSAIAYSDFSTALKDSLAVVVIDNVSEFANYPNTLRQKVLIWRDANRGGVFILKQTGSPNGGTIFQGTPSVNKWVRITEDERIDCKWFGAVGDGTTDDDVAMQAWANYVGNNNLHGYISKGTYLVDATVTVDSFSNVIITGDGELSVIKRKTNTALSTSNPSGSLTRLLRIDGTGGDNLVVRDIAFDGNAQNQGSPDSATAWQQYHSLYIVPSGSLGFNHIDLHNIYSFNPLGDGIGINSSSSAGVGEVNVSHIYEYNRPYTRSTVTFTTNFNKINASNIFGIFEVEPNGFSGPSTTYRYNLNLSNSSLVELDLNLLGARAAGRKGDVNISNVTVRGRTVVQEFDANISGCKFYLNEPFRMAYGSYRIEQTLFYADSAFNITTGAFMLYEAAANPTDYAYFEDCDFKRHSSVTNLDYVYSDDNGFGTNTREISFTKCRFGDNTNVIRTAGVRSGKYIFDGCNHSYATSNSSCINYRGSAAKSSITNEMHVYRNTIDNNTSFLVGHPLASNLLKYYSQDNKVWDGQLIYWSRYDSIGGLKGPVTNLRLETPAVYYQSKGSSLSATNKPNTGKWAKGDIFYYAVPINGYMGVVCDTSGNGDGTSATGATAGAKFSYFGPVSEGVNSALAGDVSGEYNANVIGNNKVTNAKLATAPAWTLKGRNAGSTGNVSDMAVTDFTTDASPASGEYVVGFNAGGLVKYDIAGILSGGTSYTFSTGLTNSSGTITSNLSTGISGGQSLYGGTAASDTLRILSTTNSAKGLIKIGATNINEATNRWGINTTSPASTFTVRQLSIASVGSGSGTSAIDVLNVLGATGGATSTNTGVVSGGKGGVTLIVGGVGGDITGTPGTGTGGAGGEIKLTGGNGGTGTTFGGSGGYVEIAGGTSGFGTSNGQPGYVSLKGGNAFGSGNSDGGNIYLVPGTKSGTGVDGAIYLGLSPSNTARGNVKIGGSSSPIALLTIGEAGSKLGDISLAGNTSGTVTIRPAAAAGTWTLTLPTDDGNSGYVLQTDGAGVTSWVAASGGGGTVTNTGGALTSNSVVLGAGTNDVKVVSGIITDGTSQLTLGVAGTSVGAVNFKNATSGTITVQPTTGALGTVTLTLPATSGTFYVSGGTDVAVADGGTGLSSGTSGGILGYTASGTIASSVALTANALVLGGGAGATPTPMGSLGTTTTVLHGNAAGAPTFGAVSLTADVSGDLPFANLTQIAGLSVLGVTGASTADVAAITGTTDQVLRVNTAGTGLGFGTIATGGITNNAVTFAKMQTVSASVFLGNDATGTAVEELSVSTAKTMLGITGTNSGDVTLAGENYLSIAGQVITANAVNLSGTNVTGTLAAARFGALTGDVTSAGSSYATTLATVNSNVGSFGSTTVVPVITVNGKGLITAVSTATIAGTTVNEYYVTGLSGTTINLSTGTIAATKGTGTAVNVDLPSGVNNVELYKNGVYQAYTDGTTTRDWSYNAGTDIITISVTAKTSDIFTIKVRQ